MVADLVPVSLATASLLFAVCIDGTARALPGSFAAGEALILCNAVAVAAAALLRAAVWPAAHAAAAGLPIVRAVGTSLRAAVRGAPTLIDRVVDGPRSDVDWALLLFFGAVAATGVSLAPWLRIALLRDAKQKASGRVTVSEGVWSGRTRARRAKDGDIAITVCGVGATVAFHVACVVCVGTAAACFGFAVNNAVGEW